MKKSKLIYKIDKWYRHPNCQLKESISNLECKEYKIKVRQKRRKIYKITGTRWDFPIKRQRGWKSRAKIKHQYTEFQKSTKELNYYDNNLADKNDFLFKLKKLKEKDGIGWYYFTQQQIEYGWARPVRYNDTNYHYIAQKLFKEGLIIAEFFCEDIQDLTNLMNIKIIRCKLFD